VLQVVDRVLDHARLCCLAVLAPLFEVVTHEGGSGTRLLRPVDVGGGRGVADSAVDAVRTSARDNADDGVHTLVAEPHALGGHGSETTSSHGGDVEGWNGLTGAEGGGVEVEQLSGGSVQSWVVVSVQVEGGWGRLATWLHNVSAAACAPRVSSNSNSAL